MSRTKVVCLFAGAVAVMAASAGISLLLDTDRARPPAPDLAQLESRLDQITATLQRIESRAEARAGRSQPPASPDLPTRAADELVRRERPDSPGSTFSNWSDEELYFAARRADAELGLVKAALARSLSSERRAELLLTLAGVYRRFDPNGALERAALTDAVQASPSTSAHGAQAALELGNVLAFDPQSRWESTQYYDAVLRDAPSESLRMQAAYRLAWKQDLGDTPRDALAAFRQFLAEWGETWGETAEASWARHRVELLQQGE